MPSRFPSRSKENEVDKMYKRQKATVIDITLLVVYSVLLVIHLPLVLGMHWPRFSYFIRGTGLIPLLSLFLSIPGLIYTGRKKLNNLFTLEPDDLPNGLIIGGNNPSRWRPSRYTVIFSPNAVTTWILMNDLQYAWKTLLYVTSWGLFDIIYMDLPLTRVVFTLAGLILAYLIEILLLSVLMAAALIPTARLLSIGRRAKVKGIVWLYEKVAGLSSDSDA